MGQLTIGGEGSGDEVFGGKTKTGDVDEASRVGISESDGGGGNGRVRPDPYYLRLTMGRPVGRPLSRSTPTMAYGLQVPGTENLFFFFRKMMLF
jgi:hypothetical protein